MAPTIDPMPTPTPTLSLEVGLTPAPQQRRRQQQEGYQGTHVKPCYIRPRLGRSLTNNHPVQLKGLSLALALTLRLRNPSDC